MLQEETGLNKFLFALFIIGCLVGCSGDQKTNNSSVSAVVPTVQKPSTPTELKIPDKFQAELEEYFAAHGDGTWWLEGRPQSSDIPKDQDKRVRENVEFVFKHFGDVSPEAKKITQAFSKFNVGYTIQAPDGPSIMLDGKSHPGGKAAIVFFSHEDKPYQESALWYNGEKKMVFIAAVNWPPHVFAAGLMHELYHAWRDATNVSPTSQNPDDYAAEEVAAHTLEAKVLDRATNGEYFKTIDTMLGAMGVTDWHEAYKVIRKTNLQTLDTVLGTEKTGGNVLDALVAEHMFVAGWRCIEKNVPKAGQQKALNEYYLFTRGKFGSN